MSEVKRVPREKNCGHFSNDTFDAKTPPILKVEPGEKFIAEIEDTHFLVYEQCLFIIFSSR